MELEGVGTNTEAAEAVPLTSTLTEKENTLAEEEGTGQTPRYNF
jgi:hypothetical protein